MFLHYFVKFRTGFHFSFYNSNIIIKHLIKISCCEIKTEKSMNPHSVFHTLLIMTEEISAFLWKTVDSKTAIYTVFFKWHPIISGITQSKKNRL